VDTAGCILQGDVRTKVKTPGTGEIMVEETVQTSTRRGCANSIISQSRVMPGPQHTPHFQQLSIHILISSTLTVGRGRVNEGD
jgi:hypothetical protein